MYGKCIASLKIDKNYEKFIQTTAKQNSNKANEKPFTQYNFDSQQLA